MDDPNIAWCSLKEKIVGTNYTFYLIFLSILQCSLKYQYAQFTLKLNNDIFFFFFHMVKCKPNLNDVISGRLSVLTIRKYHNNVIIQHYYDCV